VDVSRTVGWFTATYQVLLEGVEGGEVEGGQGERSWDIGRGLSGTKEELRRVPNRGFGYGVLRYGSEEEQVRRTLEEMPQPEIAFNYLGQFDQVFRSQKLFSPARESPGKGIADENHSLHTFEVSAMVARGRLQVSWTYSEKLHRRETIEQLANNYVERLREIIAHCRGEHAGGFTPSDFPLAKLDQKKLSQLAALMNK